MLCISTSGGGARTRSIYHSARLLIFATLLFAVGFTADARAESDFDVNLLIDQVSTNGGSAYAAVSGNGRFVAFESTASDLVDGDTNGCRDVFVHDRESGLTLRVSVHSSGAEANDDSFSPWISQDGRTVVFSSLASNLVENDTNGDADIFVHDRNTGLTERISVRTDGGQAQYGWSNNPSISSDGRFLAFESSASNLVPRGDPFKDVYVHDRETGKTKLITASPSSSTTQRYGDSASLSADGRYVAFRSNLSDLVSGDDNDRPDIFVHDRYTGVAELISVASDGTQGNLESLNPSISADGRFVTFWSAASNLVDGDNNDDYDVFVRDRATGVTSLVSAAANGVVGNGASRWPSISADGSVIAFESDATDLDPLDQNTETDIYVALGQNGSGPRLDGGTVTQVGDDWQSVSLPQVYTDPVIVASVQYGKGSSPAVTRLRNVTGGQFELRVQNPGGTSLPNDHTVHYVVAESGVYNLFSHGIQMEAVKTNSTVTDSKSLGFVGEEQSYQQSYTRPVVLGQVMSDNDSLWSVFWAHGRNRWQTPDHRLWVGKHVGEDTQTARTDETLGYLVFEAGSGETDGTGYEVGLTAQAIFGTFNTALGFPYAQPSSLTAIDTGVVSAVAMLGADGGWPILYGSDALADGEMDLAFEEDQISDRETAHRAEAASYLLLGTQ